ncbi:MAG TPA: ATP-dependent helicase [Acidimicrobiales bacterium]|nr:ATP-dependent helicase [Acidimicrobiales bacterium]
MAAGTLEGGTWRPPPGLTEAQRQAVMASEPLVCVLAGAGAGKTRVLTLRVARRCHDRSAEARRVLVCTFSRRAADELRSRLWALDVDGPTTGTFHRTALALLRQWRAERGAGPPEVLADRRAALAAVLAERRGAAPAGRARRRAEPAPAALSQLESEIGWAKARLVAPQHYEEAAVSQRRRTVLPAATVAELYRRYEEVRQRRGLLDLDDLLLACYEALAGDDAFARAVRWRFRHLFVDEMQDVNPAQFRLLMALLGDEPDLFVVGDPRQSVYGWNGADPTLLDRLPELLPGTRQIRLDENHRSTPQVVAVAASVLGLDHDRGIPTSNRPDGPVPRVVAHDTDAEEAEWVARQLWLAHRPGRRWSQLAVLARTNTQLQAVASALGRARIPFQLAGADLAPASDVPARAGGRAGQPDDGAGGEEGTGGRAGHGDDGAGDADSGDAHGGVVLATFHRAKGLQWPAVFVIGLSADLMPLRGARSPAARDEERRLLYVALSRAEVELTCTWARYRDNATRAAGEAPRAPSPWLDPVVQACEALRTSIAPPDPAEVAARLAALRARLLDRA